eukprot:3089533-Amphidinium_carterae.1
MVGPTPETQNPLQDNRKAYCPSQDGPGDRVRMLSSQHHHKLDLLGSKYCHLPKVDCKAGF